MAQDLLPNSATDLATSGEAAQTATEEDDLAFKRILVPIDFSEHSKKTVSCAITLALGDNAMVQLLHVFQISDYVVTPFGLRKEQADQVKSQIDAAEQDARKHLAPFEHHSQKRRIESKLIPRV